MNDAFTIETLAKTEFYTEGPVLDRGGNLYFTTITGGTIMKMAPNDPPGSWAIGGWPNGQRILSNGDHLVCDSKNGAVIRFGKAGNQIRVEAGGAIEGVKVQVPNDLAIDGDHGFYFTDSISKEGMVYYIGFNGDRKIVVKELDYPNGIVLSRDKKTMFVTESNTNRVLRIVLKGRGIAGGKPEVFTNLPQNPHPRDPDDLPNTGNLPDGIALDNKDHLWVAHYGMQALQVIDPSGKLVRTVDTGIPATSNLCFDESDYKTIYVTGGIREPGPGLVNKLIKSQMTNYK